jgi:hypothetical protein
MFKDFAGGACTDTSSAFSPRRMANTQLRVSIVCGSSYPFFFVYLSTGNSNPGYEYTPIVELSGVAPEQTSVRWSGPDQLFVTYPGSATVIEAYAKVLDVQVVLDPALPQSVPASSFEMNRG